MRRIERKRRGLFSLVAWREGLCGAETKTNRSYPRLFRSIRWISAKTNPLYPFVFAFIASTVQAQVKPDADWKTIETRHFYVHFTPELESLARRAAVNAESAYVQLSRHLRPPRGRIDMVVSDDVDFSNGSATPFPSNRIIIYANPPVFEGALRFTDDPTRLVVTHELAHTFHMDRAGGIWKVLQSVFGRSPFFFPNVYQPAWLVEGLAVYYESLLTGSGRLVGSEHRMIARSAAIAHQLPRLDEVSLASPHFPYGYSAYAYGSLFVDHLARKHGDRSILTFVESSSRQLVPMLLDFPARRAFGSSFTRAYRQWSDSLTRAAPPGPLAPPLPRWRDLTVDGAYAAFPRWVDDSTLVYTGTPGRESYGAYRLEIRSADSAGTVSTIRRERIGRRNSRSPNQVLTDGSLLYSQLEFTSPYTLRSDLYVDRARGGTMRLTHGRRLAFPDARADGLIVAVNIVPAGTRLVLVSSDGRTITPITDGSADEQWAEPRWSPDGSHIAAIRWTRGGSSEVVVVDSSGMIVATPARAWAIHSSPSWSPDGRHVYFSSDRGGTANIYRAAFVVAAADSALARVSDTQTGLFEPQASPSGDEIAAVVFRADGYHVGAAPVSGLIERPESALDTARTPPIAVASDAPAADYSPWRSLLPRHWMPYFEPALDSNSVRIGAYTGGEDLVGRHHYQLAVFVPTDNSGLTGSLYYRNARFGQPQIELVAAQDWENRGCIADASQQNRCIGFLRRRSREAMLSLTALRPRMRTFSYLSAGVGVEARDYGASSPGLLDRIDSLYRRTYYYPRLTLSSGFSNVQYPLLAISPEDGVSLASTARFRWRTGESASGTLSLVGTTAAYKSLALPGYAHHVLALRAAAGIQDNRGTGYFEVGGLSGGTLEVLPGYVLGEGRRTFSVRGFPAAAQLGIVALSGNVEYRLPLRLPGRGLFTLPVFFDRTSITVFGDAGAAWCPGLFSQRPVPATSLCTQSDFDGGFVTDAPNAMASAGAELNVSAAVLSWDAPFTYRVGIAAPVVGRETVTGERAVSWYFTVGASF